jgi:hypothetical protein
LRHESVQPLSGPTNDRIDRPKALGEIPLIVRNDSKPAYRSSGLQCCTKTPAQYRAPCADVRHCASIPPTPLEAIEDALLALQLLFLRASESMGNHDSKIVDAGSVD